MSLNSTQNNIVGLNSNVNRQLSIEFELQTTFLYSKSEHRSVIWGCIRTQTIFWSLKSTQKCNYNSNTQYNSIFDSHSNLHYWVQFVTYC